MSTNKRLYISQNGVLIDLNNGRGIVTPTKRKEYVRVRRSDFIVDYFSIFDDIVKVKPQHIGT